LDTNENIVGGFTPVEWERRMWNGKYDNQNTPYKPDSSLQSFVCTLKNPHNLPARRFALKDDKKYQAIRSVFNYGPCFGDDVVIWDMPNRINNSTSFDTSYTNDTGLNGMTFFTGARTFQVNDIEVFQIS
jgi:hypothetical protein